jgi:hypothetical protein
VFLFLLAVLGFVQTVGACTRGQELCALEFSDDANADACQP